MATIEYYKLEQRDSLHTGQKRFVHRLKNNGLITARQFISKVTRNKNYSPAAVTGILIDVADELARLIAEGRGAVLSLEHPDALFTANHALARNRLLFALADAAFVFNTDGRRGEAEALQSRACDWIYAWEGYPGNRALIARGAKPFSTLDDDRLAAMSRRWASSGGEQISLFDLI